MQEAVCTHVELTLWVSDLTGQSSTLYEEGGGRGVGTAGVALPMSHHVGAKACYSHGSSLLCATWPPALSQLAPALFLEASLPTLSSFSQNSYTSSQCWTVKRVELFSPVFPVLVLP